MSLENSKSPEASTITFAFPNVETERGEIERVGQEFSEEELDVFVSRFIEVAKKAQLISMSEEMWSRLENTDSYDILPGDWEKVDSHFVAGKPEAPRDWQKLKSKLEKGENLDAPIIYQKGDKLHLVSGNTRLMVVRALGKTPQVLLVNIN